MKKITKTYLLNFYKLSQNDKDISLYRIYRCSEASANWSLYENAIKNLNNDNGFYKTKLAYPFYSDIEDGMVLGSILIDSRKDMNYIINDLSNELPIIITKIATNLKNNAIIEVDYDEEIYNKYKFDFTNLFFQICTLDTVQESTDMVCEQ